MKTDKTKTKFINCLHNVSKKINHRLFSFFIYEQSYVPFIIRKLTDKIHN